MRAVVYAAPRSVEVREVPDPHLETPEDALVRVTLSAICGTDLHAWHGLEGIPPGTPLGHEYVGEVLEVGGAVRGIRPGDRVLGSDFSACGRCWWCCRGQHWECPERAFFGYGSVFGVCMGGAQAEFLRVPYADTTLERLPDGCSEEAAIFAGDTLATAFAAAECAGVGPADVVGVVGGGTVGQMVSLACQVFGAAAVVVAEPIEERRQLATRLGGVGASPDSARAVLDGLTCGRGADVVVEALGSATGMDMALGLVRRAGTVVSVGAHFAAGWTLPVARAFAEELCVRFVIGDSIRLRAKILPLLTIGVIDPTGVVTERVTLQAAPNGYQRMADRVAVKVLIGVWE